MTARWFLFPDASGTNATLTVNERLDLQELCQVVIFPAQQLCKTIAIPILLALLSLSYGAFLVFQRLRWTIPAQSKRSSSTRIVLLLGYSSITSVFIFFQKQEDKQDRLRWSSLDLSWDILIVVVVTTTRTYRHYVQGWLRFLFDGDTNHCSDKRPSVT